MAQNKSDKEKKGFVLTVIEKKKKITKGNIPANAIGLNGPIGATDCANEFSVLDIDIDDDVVFTCDINGKFGNVPRFVVPLLLFGD